MDGCKLVGQQASVRLAVRRLDRPGTVEVAHQQVGFGQQLARLVEEQRLRRKDVGGREVFEHAVLRGRVVPIPHRVTQDQPLAATGAAGHLEGRHLRRRSADEVPPAHDLRVAAPAAHDALESGSIRLFEQFRFSNCHPGLGARGGAT